MPLSPTFTAVAGENLGEPKQGPKFVMSQIQARDPQTHDPRLSTLDFLIMHQPEPQVKAEERLTALPPLLPADGRGDGRGDGGGRARAGPTGEITP